MRSVWPTERPDRRRSLARTVPLLLSVVGAACADSEPVDPRASVVELSIETCELNLTGRATAVIIDDGLALTVAHSFEDSQGVRFTDGPEADVVYLDRDRDIALISFAPAGEPSLGIVDDSDDPADDARLVVVRDGEAVVRDVGLLRRQPVTLDGEGRRQGIEIEADIDRGDSGAPIVDDSGTIIGIVFASSRTSDTGWAIAASEFTDIAGLAGDAIPLACSN